MHTALCVTTVLPPLVTSLTDIASPADTETMFVVSADCNAEPVAAQVSAVATEFFISVYVLVPAEVPGVCVLKSRIVPAKGTLQKTNVSPALLKPNPK